MIFEKGTDMKQNTRDLFRNLSPAALGTGFVAAMFSIMGPALIVMNSAKQGNIPVNLAISWLFALYMVGGLFTIFMSLRYRQPIVTAYSIPGAVLVGSALTHIPFNEAVGAFLITGIVVTVLGASGLIKKAINYLPLPVMLGMIAGVILSFGTKLIQAVVDAPIVGGASFLAFFLLLAMKKFSKKIPPILGSIIVGGVLATLMGQTKWSTLSFSLASPTLVMPVFSMQAFLELSLPLIILVIGVQNIQAIGVLYATGYKPPINAMFTVPGIGTIINAIFGAHPAVIAGPSTAICSSDTAGERKDLRYVASTFDGVLWLLFGLVAGVAIAASAVVPSQFLSILAGLAMFNVFISTFSEAFSGKFKMGAMMSFLVAVSNVTILKVGAPFWALIVGVLVSLLLERSDFLQLKKTRTAEENLAA